jgi:hypothetical protein
MGYGPQIPGLDKSGGGVNLAAPGPIGGTTAGSGAFTTLTASSTLAVTAGTTLTGRLTLGNGGGSLFAVDSGTLNDMSGSATLTLGTNGPSSGVSGPGPIRWVRIIDTYWGQDYYMPLWGNPPP